MQRLSGVMGRKAFQQESAQEGLVAYTVYGSSGQAHKVHSRWGLQLISRLTGRNNRE
jgi:hypothetical protein